MTLKRQAATVTPMSSRYITTEGREAGKEATMATTITTIEGETFEAPVLSYEEARADAERLFEAMAHLGVCGAQYVIEVEGLLLHVAIRKGEAGATPILGTVFS